MMTSCVASFVHMTWLAVLTRFKKKIVLKEFYVGERTHQPTIIEHFDARLTGMSLRRKFELCIEITTQPVCDSPSKRSH